MLYNEDIPTLQQKNLYLPPKELKQKKYREYLEKQFNRQNKKKSGLTQSQLDL